MNTRIKELDGLRGIALILVVTLHLTNRAIHFTQAPILHFLKNFFAVGWVGLDIFFPLSGFLITSILLQTRDEEHYFKNFYMHRVLKVFPLYYVLLITTLFFVPELEEDFVKNLDIVLPVVVLYQQNWAVLFPNFHFSSYLGITWSVAILVQFYLLLPFFVYKFNKKQLVKIFIWYILISMLARICNTLLLLDTKEVALFFKYASFARLEQFLFGSLLAVYLTYQGSKEIVRRFSYPTFIFSFIILVILVWFALPGEPSPYAGNVSLMLSGYTSTALITVGLIGIFVTSPPQNFLRRIFQTRLFVFLGKHSYSIYLFHVTVALIVLDIFWVWGFRGWQAYLLYLVVTYGICILVGLLTWYLIETPLLRLKKYFPYKNPIEF